MTIAFRDFHSHFCRYLVLTAFLKSLPARSPPYRRSLNPSSQASVRASHLPTSIHSRPQSEDDIALHAPAAPSLRASVSCIVPVAAHLSKASKPASAPIPSGWGICSRLHRKGLTVLDAPAKIYREVHWYPTISQVLSRTRMTLRQS